MQSHQDRPDHDRSALMRELFERADQLTEEGENKITAGEPDEDVVRKWKRGDMLVNQMPDDPQGVLRISVGGNVGFGYCTFRGPRKACLSLLSDAVKALAQGD